MLKLYKTKPTPANLSYMFLLFKQYINESNPTTPRFNIGKFMACQELKLHEIYTQDDAPTIYQALPVTGYHGGYLPIVLCWLNKPR